ncbi:tyrosine-protein kinase transmembrane receptor Ror2 [Tribolium castaneum]|nr:PREDICTED: tyrosine-protein kinase transmembrane receptor Ror2 [Tribolium castaneum]|eukprot:XP_008193390.1 PREDICTED: tyrosine-protein kinase transmembrane receptor Ror2 [Tribolium castaneum]
MYLLVILLVVFSISNGEIQSYCGIYGGKICENYVGHSKMVWFNNSGGFENEEITKALWREVIETFNEPCRRAAEKLLCFYAFPDCYLGNPLPLCHEDCIAVKQLFCYKEWAHIEDRKSNGFVFKSRGHFRLPVCEKLPKYQIVNNTATCSYAGLVELKVDEITHDCIKGRGRFYQGNVNVTKDGLACQRWDSQKPHSHNSPPDIFPELKNSENYCRNAGGEEKKPWCFTTNSSVRWQHCDIPRCPNSTSEESEDAAIAMDTFLSPSFLIIYSVIGLLGVIILTLLILLCHRIHKHRLGYNPTDTAEVNIDLDKLPSNMAYHRHGVTLNPKLEKLEFPRNDIIYIKDLGQGAFGRVFQAKAPGLVSGEEFTLVAVKMLKDDASEDMQDDFEKEACLLAEFDHPNIVKLLGVCAIGRPMCLLFEYMGKGDLNEFLRQCSPSNYVVRSVVDGEYGSRDVFKDNQLNHLELLEVALQIASGMVYLSDRKFVHRDLATRNCLINENMVVKIADFGLSQKIYLQDYYKGSERDAIPVRWMPLESILYNKYTPESDVWAFGVCLWEIFSFALQPYFGMTHEEVVRFLKAGNVLASPENTPAAIYQVMKDCWAQKPVDRPNFRTIHQTLTNIQSNMLAMPLQST